MADDLTLNGMSLEETKKFAEQAVQRLESSLLRASALVDSLTSLSWKGQTAARVAEEYQDWYTNLASLSSNMKVLGTIAGDTALAFDQLDADKAQGIKATGADSTH